LLSVFPCSDGDDLESAYSENHVKDLCIVRKPSSGVRAGLFAWGLTDDILPAVPLLCELDDTDGDGVYDDADLCPNTANPKGKKLWNGCSKFDLDADNDKVCDFSVGPNPFCSGLDNCPTVPNHPTPGTPATLVRFLGVCVWAGVDGLTPLIFLPRRLQRILRIWL
jgi:Thrombospondin type 3 repeat